MYWANLDSKMPLTDELLILTVPCKITMVNFVTPPFNGSVESRFAQYTVEKPDHPTFPTVYWANLDSAKPLKNTVGS